MQNPQEERLAGLAGLEAVTTLLQRRRRAHPIAGLYEAAELQFWWRIPRRTDNLGQLFWSDDQGQPEAAVFMADFSSGGSAHYDEVTFCPFFMPDASPEQVAYVIERGLALASEQGFTSVELEVDQADDVLNEVLAGRGFSMKEKDEHQRRGLARHLLTAGADLLVNAGAERISIGYEPANPASGHLYRSVGFEPVKTTDLLSGPIGPQPVSPDTQKRSVS